MKYRRVNGASFTSIQLHVIIEMDVILSVSPLYRFAVYCFDWLLQVNRMRDVVWCVDVVCRLIVRMKRAQIVDVFPRGDAVTERSRKELGWMVVSIVLPASLVLRNSIDGRGWLGQRHFSHRRVRLKIAECATWVYFLSPNYSEKKIIISLIYDYMT